MVMREEALDYRLLNDFQRNFPLCPAPFAELAARLGVAEDAVLRMLEQLLRDRKMPRVGAVFAPSRIGASTLAAMTVTPEKLRIVADTISRFPEVNHNYERDHRYNLWFVVTAGLEGRLLAVLGAIEQAVGYSMLKLPLVQDIPNAWIGEFAALLANEPGVYLCFQRPRVLLEWQYNFFCMILGLARDEVEAKITELRSRLKLTGGENKTLFSIPRFKQTGARYAK